MRNHSFSYVVLVIIISAFTVVPSKAAAISWHTIVTQTNYPLPGNAGQAFRFQPIQARCVKVEGTRLRSNVGDGNQYRMQFAEVEVYIRNPTGTQFSTVNIASGSSIATSSSYDYIGWSQDDINDGQWDSSPQSMGWSSRDSTKVDHTEWIGLDLGAQYLVQSVILYPRNDTGGIGQGFPIDFNIQVSDDVNCFG